MAHVFTFTTERFREADEPPNPTNPIGGQAVLAWLCAQLKGSGFTCGTPDAEDWGWYTHIAHGERTYLLGASGDWPESGASVDWTIQLELSRSMKDKLFGRNKLADDDAVSAAVERAIRGESAVSGLGVDRQAS